MNIFVAGATGTLGRELVPQLVARGHEVVGMTRSESKQDLVRSLRAGRWWPTPAAVHPLGGGLPGAADDERRGRDRHAGCDQITDTLPLTDGQDRICMKIHKSPPLGRDP
jgi:nucleoside-diphosphate-sugar epimerase